MLDLSDILDADELTCNITVAGRSGIVAVWQDDEQPTEDDFGNLARMATVWIDNDAVSDVGYRTEVVTDNETWYVQSWKNEAGMYEMRVETELRRSGR